MEEPYEEISYLKGLTYFFESVNKLVGDVEADFYKESVPAERAKFPVVRSYTTASLEQGESVARISPPEIAEITMQIVGAGGIAAAAYSLIRRWVEAKNGRRIRVQLGDFEIEASQLSHEEFETVCNIIMRWGEVPLSDVERQLTAGGYIYKSSRDLYRENSRLVEAARRERVGDGARLTLVRGLSGLAPGDWAVLVTAIPGAGPHVSRQGSVAEQVAELVRWVESSDGPGLATIERAYKELRGP